VAERDEWRLSDEETFVSLEVEALQGDVNSLTTRLHSVRDDASTLAARNRALSEGMDVLCYDLTRQWEFRIPQLAE